MKFFFRHRNSAASVAPEPVVFKPDPCRSISLSTEQKDLLDRPLDPRVDRIMHQIFADKSAAQRALLAEGFSSDSGEPQVVQDENGFWRIVYMPKKKSPLFDAL